MADDNALVSAQRIWGVGVLARFPGR